MIDERQCREFLALDRIAVVGASADERQFGNVVYRALRDHGIRYPNALDNDRATWDLYGIRYWPSYVLIDRDGQIRYEGYGEFHVGDRQHQLWDARIRALLDER